MRTVLGSAALLVVSLMVLLALVGCPAKEAPPDPAPATPAGPATSAAPPAPETPVDEPEPATDDTVTLTSEILDQWMVSVADPRVKNTLAALKPTGKISFTEMAANADKAGAHPDVDVAVKGMGYADGAEWAAVTKRVFAGLLPMTVKQGQDQLKAKMTDQAKIDDMMKQTNAKIDEIHEAFGELTDEETKLVEEAAAKLAGAMG